MSDNETAQEKQPFEARFILDVGDSITVDLTNLQVKRDLTGELREISWTSAPGGRTIAYLDLQHVVAILTNAPREEGSHE